VVGADAIGGHVQGLSLVVGDPGGQGVDLVLRDAEAVGGEAQAVEAGGQIEQRRVTAGAHIGNDGGDDRVHVWGVLAFLRQEGLDGGLEAGVGGGEELRHGDLPGGSRFA
jgi:hypothetical protein